jgi:membrane protein DedA with SNARE-associated domain
LATALPRPRPSRRTLVMIVTPIIVLISIGTIANAIHPTLVKNHPLLLVALEPRNRWIILVADKVSFWPLLIFGTLRRLASDPLFFLLGHLYGDGAVRWAERKFDFGTGTIQKIERIFQKAGPVLVFFAPGALVCVLSGATGMSPVLFFVLNVLGTIFTVTVLYHFASVVEGPVDAINGFYGNNFKWLTVVTVTLTALYIWNQWRQGKTEIQSLTALEDELVASDPEIGEEVGEGREEPAT